MRYTTLVSTATLGELLGNPAVAIVDCRFDLAKPDAGERSYEQAHIPGAIYAHLDRDLSGAKTGRNGRHPLPPAAQLADTFSRFGIDATIGVGRSTFVRLRLTGVHRGKRSRTRLRSPADERPQA